MACSVCRKGMPPLTQQVRSLLQAVSGSIKAFVNGQPVFSYGDMKRRRVNICKQCNKYDQGSKRCSICGCYIHAKASLAKETCPDNPSKW